WLLGWAFYLFGVYAPSVRKFREKKIERERTRLLDALIDFTTFTAWQIVPLIYIFSSWFDYADYELPDWTRWLGAACFTGALVILWRAYHDLGESWSPKLDTRQGQGLVTTGIYRLIRHPIYAGIWLWAFAHPLLFHNWVVGLGFMLTFTPLYFMRVPREEALMIETFGDAYRAYMRQTGRVLPRPGRQS
ncbi:MAG: isoprenylcysteine carboxylmethyltransferase family protein, partial [Anaerolineales bacterium]